MSLISVGDTHSCYRLAKAWFPECPHHKYLKVGLETIKEVDPVNTVHDYDADIEGEGGVNMDIKEKEKEEEEEEGEGEGEEGDKEEEAEVEADDLEEEELQDNIVEMDSGSDDGDMFESDS